MEWLLVVVVLGFLVVSHFRGDARRRRWEEARFADYVFMEAYRANRHNEWIEFFHDEKEDLTEWRRGNMRFRKSIIPRHLLNFQLNLSPQFRLNNFW